MPGRLVISDAGYGVSGPFRTSLEERSLRNLVGFREMVVFQAGPKWDEPAPRQPGGRGRQATRSKLGEDSPRAMTLKELAGELPRYKVTWRGGTKGRMWARFAWVRGRSAAGPSASARAPSRSGCSSRRRLTGRSALRCRTYRGGRAGSERFGSGKAGGKWHKGYQQMKEGFGLDHHEGRSWRGYNHHISLVMMAFGFLVPERDREESNSGRPGKKGVATQRLRCRRSVGRCKASWSRSAGTIAPTARANLPPFELF